MEFLDPDLRALLDPLPTAWDPRPGMEPAAVFAPLVRRSGTEYLLFTRRRDDLPHHGGQVSFPGGRRAGDEGPVACAVREASEELGVAIPAFAPLGALPARASNAGFWVNVVVGRLDPDPALAPQEAEVARILEVPLHDLLDSSSWQALPVPGGRLRSPHFPWDGETIWGLTGRLTVDLLSRLLPGAWQHLAP